ncbi:MAG: hypothetical protein KF861_16100, partial [Planctomycetaceae bacterium]|nr:hypothetical protein [Planctomycetaceae bacterium]
MISQSPRIRIPESVEDKLKEVRQARDRAHLALWAVVGLLALLLVMSLAMLADWMLVLFDPRWRIALTAAALGSAAVAMLVAARVIWRRGRRLDVIAREVDQAVPRIEERWWTVAELAAAPLDQQRTIHSGMLKRLERESAKWDAYVIPEEIVSLRGTLYAVIAVCGIVLAWLTACIIDWQQTKVLAQRFWAPTANISVTQLDAPDVNRVAAR